MDISFELYKVFYYVASTLSFSEASKQLFISQSAVSQSIKSLEKKLDQQLFIRSTKNVMLTSAGEALFQHIEPAVNLIHQGESELQKSTELTGRLRIGASDTICRYFLVPYLKKFHDASPNLHIQVVNQTSVGCVDLLESGQVDLIITNYPNEHLKHAQDSILIHEFQDLFVANPKYYPQKEDPLTLSELLDYPILMLSRKSTTSEYLHQLFSQKGLTLHPEAELGSNDLLIDLARIGLGIAFVPDFMLRANSDLVKVRLKESLPKRQLMLTCSHHLPQSVTTQKFLELFATR